MNDKTRKYIFLSYSHKDKIEELLRMFDRAGYNLVYDETMSFGEEWDLKARRMIGSDLCCGAVVCLTQNSLKSKAVLNELGYIGLNQKAYFAVTDGDPYAISDAAIANATEDEKYIVESIVKFFPKEKLFLTVKELSDGSARFCTTMAEWGISADRHENREYEMPQYTSGLVGEETRLLQQQGGYLHFDREVLDEVAGSYGDRKITVLDLGCGVGDVAFSRFNDYPNVAKVIGVDYNPDDIEKANKKYASDRFSFFCLNLEDDDFVDKLKKALHSAGVEKIDVAFMALTLHHLKKPPLFLLRLFDFFDDDGKIVVRGSDDGGKLFYPNSELMQTLFLKYDELAQNGSDRYNARKLYWLLSENGYTKTRMYYRTTDTCGKTRAEKEYKFKIGFEFRKSRLEALTQKYPEDRELAQKVDEYVKLTEKFKLCFCSPQSWYCVTSYIAVAEVR